MKKYLILEKAVGETPLSCTEDYRALHPELEEVAMTYAGRLDPMASGKLLILLGEECKKQTNYHSLDKEYDFSVLLGIGSDTHDVLGRLHSDVSKNIPDPTKLLSKLEEITNSLTGDIELPYPHFSSKTVQGKALHTWALEGKIDEIKIPTKESVIYSLKIVKTETLNKEDLVNKTLEKVNSIPSVTDIRKAIGNDFRRVDVRSDWENVRNDNSLPNTYTIIHLKCLASSGTYMRSLAKIIGNSLHTYGLAWHIHRTKIGRYEAEKNIWSHEF